MRNRIRNINILVILLVSVFLIIPKDVSAEIMCSDNTTKMTCEYHVPATNTLGDAVGDIVGTAVLGVFYNATHAVHGEFDFVYNICTDGYGAMKAQLYKSGTSDYTVINDFTKDSAVFYDSSTNIGSCPKAWIFVDNNMDILEDSNIHIATSKAGATEKACYNCSIYEVEPNESFNNGKPWYLGSGEVTPEDIEDCTAILGDEEYSLGWLIKKFLFYFKIAAPILVLLLSTMDFIKAIVTNDDDTMKKVQKKLIIRIIIAILLLIIPTIVELLLDVFGFTASKCIL